ncbi:helix-turn-helix domain-containing protein [uncultured Caulobacter sp.]|uniref:AraC family transcriptional regulator n=1 Tax=uncultured Caulobacter sp. TaxID=158749 RepID=UPI00260F9719|nr:helix-turn-helix domain-containing protein [uncultured Caulobacter sp.]
MSRKRRLPADEPFVVIRSAAADLPRGGAIGGHAHDWSQLVHVAAGLASVRTAAGAWVAPPSGAVWVPAGLDHTIRFVGPSAFRTLYIRPDWRDDLPRAAGALAVSGLLRELILRTVEVGMLDRRDATEAALAALIAGELQARGPPPFVLPAPTSHATRRAIALEGDIATVARTVGLAPRTLERRFLAETGVSFGRWRQQSRLLRGLERAAGGASIKAAAEAAGYASPSAYVAAFRKAFGETPGKYFDV